MNDLPELPSEWISRLFLRFQAVYGNRVSQMWGDADPNEVRRAWGEKLAGFEGADLKYALDALEYLAPDFPPTLHRFVDLCRQSRSKRVGEMLKLTPPDPRGDELHPEVADVIDRFVESAREGKRDTRRWAQRIIERENSGERLPLCSLKAARGVLGLAPPK